MFLFSTLTIAAPKKVLIEVLTNSHCPLCPAAHSTIDAYLQNGQYKDQVNYIYYHMAFPYSDDALYQHNPTDASARNSFYGPFSSTPRGIFDGALQSNSYANWGSAINNLAIQSSPFEITLQGTAASNNVTIKASIKQTENISLSNLIAHFVAVETVNYAGRNGITLHKNVMRKMFPNSSGRSFSISFNQTLLLEEVTSLNAGGDLSKLGYVIFIQNSQTKTVYQSEYVTYNQLITTNVESDISLPIGFSLSQNFPNPFNPSTTISYQIPEAAKVEIKVYNLIGKEVAVLIDEQKPAGKHSINFEASQLPGGVYFYKITAGRYAETKKMILLK